MEEDRDGGENSYGTHKGLCGGIRPHNCMYLFANKLFHKYDYAMGIVNNRIKRVLKKIAIQLQICQKLQKIALKSLYFNSNLYEKDI